MSITVIAELVLGFVVPRECMRSPPHRTCAHQETQARFCAECGKPMWVQDNEIIELGAGTDLEVFNNNTPNFHRVDNDQPMIIGRKLASRGPLPLDFMPDREEQLELEDLLRQEIQAAGIKVDAESLELRLHLVRYIS